MTTSAGRWSGRSMKANGLRRRPARHRSAPYDGNGMRPARHRSAPYNGNGIRAGERPATRGHDNPISA